MPNNIDAVVFHISDVERFELQPVTTLRFNPIHVHKSLRFKADVTYESLAERLAKHGLKGETVASIKNKLARGTFAATFLLAVLAALELEGVRLEDL